MRICFIYMESIVGSLFNLVRFSITSLDKYRIISFEYMKAQKYNTASEALYFDQQTLLWVLSRLSELYVFLFKHNSNDYYITMPLIQVMGMVKSFILMKQVTFRQVFQNMMRELKLSAGRTSFTILYFSVRNHNELYISESRNYYKAATLSFNFHYIPSSTGDTCSSQAPDLTFGIPQGSFLLYA